MNIIMKVSTRSLPSRVIAAITPDTAAAPIRSKVIRSVNCIRSSIIHDVFFSVLRLFSP